MKPLRYRRIIAPVDFSKFSKASLRLAARLAAEHRSELYLVHVLEHYIGLETFYDSKTRKNFLQDMRQRALAKLQADYPKGDLSDCKVVEVILQGPVAARICEFAKLKKADLIVLSPHGHSSSLLQRAWRGATHERILQQAPCPVLSVISPFRPK